MKVGYARASKKDQNLQRREHGRAGRPRGEGAWYGNERPVDILASDGGPLIGMALLHGSRLAMDVVPGGAVVIEERT